MIMGALAIKIARAGAGTLFRMLPQRGEGARAARSLHVTVAVTSLSRPLAILRTSLSALSRTGTGERGGPSWEEPEGSTRFSRLPGERRRLELGPGMGEQASPGPPPHRRREEGQEKQQQHHHLYNRLPW